MRRLLRWPRTLSSLAAALMIVGVASITAACAVRPSTGSSAAPALAGSTAVAGTRDSIAEVTLRAVVGTWDWAKGDSTCLGNTHTLAISPDGQRMTLTFRTPPDSSDPGSAVTHYRILAVGSSVAPELSPFALRGAIEDETRRTESGELVVWDLVLASANRYHWHRTDWAATGVTPAVVRCEGTQPMEQWVSPPAPGDGSRS